MQLLQKRKDAAEKRAQEVRSRQELLTEYYDTLLQLRHVRAAFEQVTEPELISACVYEMNALQERFTYLIQRMKAENITAMRVLR
ncbi:MAG: DUF2508 family protein [Clostridia bacterium]|nr:DUF2508 family protein [Clostridia bacterium]